MRITTDYTVRDLTTNLIFEFEDVSFLIKIEDRDRSTFVESLFDLIADLTKK
jgi:hypothetical protein